MAWTVTDATETFRSHCHLWDELNQSIGNHVLLDSRFVQAQLENLAIRPVHLAVETSTSAPAMMLLINEGRGRWSTFQPSQQPIGNVLFSDQARAEYQIGDLLHHLPGYAMALGITQQDPTICRVPFAADTKHAELVKYIDTGRVTLMKTFDAYWQRRPADLRESIARRRRRLKRDGIEVRLRVLQDPDHVAEGIRDYSRMEQEGWKSRTGTAVGITDAQGRFYRTMLQAMCERGEGTIYQLLFGDRPVASQICIGRGRMLISLKIAFDETFRRDAPGFLLQKQIIRHLHEQQPGIDTLEFYGRATDGWTRKWTSDVRTMFHVNYYRNSSIFSAVRAVKSVRRSFIRVVSTRPEHAGGRGSLISTVRYARA